MLTRAVLMAGLVGAVGCNFEEKRLPEKREKAATGKAADTPVTGGPSDPAAVAVVERAIKAHTDGHPELIERAKVHRLTAARKLFSVQGEIEADYSSQAVWPDKVTFTFRSDNPAFRTNTFVLNGGRGWIVSPGQPTVALRGTEASEMLADVCVEEWAALLVPFTDPQTRLHSPGTGVVDGRPCRTVKAAAPRFPELTLSFDGETHLLVRIDFKGREAEVVTDKSLRLSDHRRADGVMLPGKWEATHGGRVVARWSLGKLEYPGSIDPKAFEVAE